MELRYTKLESQKAKVRKLKFSIQSQKLVTILKLYKGIRWNGLEFFFMYIRFFTSRQGKMGLKNTSTCCGQWTVVDGRLSETFLTHSLITGPIADNHIFFTLIQII